ncbi:hypothetical protein ACFFWD_15290 [Bradyrhizobium erythrophlei]|uniref:hypothetical protein n=1 Tax=Bradyrhizobium erythrophlei TaxID=1437360 RepID=UPI0035E8DC47
MWKRLWRTWTIGKPAAFGDWLWEIFVVELAALLDRLTLRRVIAFIPVVVLILAYHHRIPIPPELMLLGDVLAYIDIFSMMILLGIVTRIATVMYVVRHAVDHALELLRRVPIAWRRLGARQRRAGATGHRKRPSRAREDDDSSAVVPGLAWA